MNKTINPDEQLSLKASTSSALPGLSLRVNFSWTLIGNLIYAASQWGMLTVLAKIGTPEMVGQFALGLAIAAPVILFSNLALQIIQATDAKQEYVFGDYLGLRLITTTVALVIIGAIVLLSGYQQEVALVILVMGLAKAIEAISDVIFGLFQQYERMDRIALSKMIKGPLSLIFLGVSIYMTRSVLWGVIALATAWALVLLSYDIHNARRLFRSKVQNASEDLLEKNSEALSLLPRWKINTLAKLAWLALPLGIGSMLNSLKTNIPRYFIESSVGLHELGIFAAVAYLIVAGRIVADALGRSASPRLAKYYAAENKRAFRNLLLKMLGVAVLMGGLAILIASVAGEQILTLLYQPEYARQSLFVLMMIVAAISFVTSFLGFAVTAARFFRVQLPILIAVIASTTIASFWLIPRFGLTGAAMALIIGVSVQAGGYLVIIIYALRSIHTNNRISFTA